MNNKILHGFGNNMLHKIWLDWMLGHTK